MVRIVNVQWIRPICIFGRFFLYFLYLQHVLKKAKMFRNFKSCEQQLSSDTKLTANVHEMYYSKLLLVQLMANWCRG